jgi:DNA-binding NarL/FixJ family response regulator
MMTDRQVVTTREIRPASNCQRCRAYGEVVRESDPQPWKVLLVGDIETDRVLFSESAKLASVAELLLADPLAFEVSFADSLATAFAALAAGPIDVVLLDLNVSHGPGLEACRRLHEMVPDIPIVALSGLDDERLAIEAVANGAQDCLVTGASLDVSLRRAIHFAIARIRQRRATSESRRNSLPDPQAAARLAQLTPRQRQVFDLLVRGKTLKQVSTQLGIDRKTASKHRARILERCDVNGEAELVCLMFAAGLAFE